MEKRDAVAAALCAHSDKRVREKEALENTPEQHTRENFSQGQVE